MVSQPPQQKGDLIVNTSISYLYRDGGNYKRHHRVILPGLISEDQAQTIRDALEYGDFFIPDLVGLPGERFEHYDPELDQPFFEMGEIEPTAEPPTVDTSLDKLVSAFEKWRGRWYSAPGVIW
jgi:hypothetical protein